MRISAITGEGTRELVYAVQEWLDQHPPSDGPPAAHGEGATDETLVLKPEPLKVRRRRVDSP
jgi:hypothetical protein